MAELDFYFSEKDELQVVVAALEKGCTVIPDLLYKSPQYELLATLEDYKRSRIRTRQFFFLSDKFFRSPLEMREIEKEGRHVFYISSRSGGPIINFLGGGIFSEDGSQFIRPGFISYHSTYENTFHQSMEKPPLEFMVMYKSLVKIVKKSGTRIKPTKRIYWLGPEAREVVEKGTKLIGLEKYSARELLK